MTRVFAWCCCAAALLLVSAHAAEKKLKVLTTFLPGYCFAANVAGNHASVENLLPGGVNLHDFQLTPAELRKLSGADLVFINGLGMEAFLDRVFANTGRETREKVITLSAGLKAHLIEMPHRHHDEGAHIHEHDPHVWLDPKLAMHCVTNVLAALQKADPANSGNYAKNAESYLRRLAELDAAIAQTVAPVKDVAFITYHNAFAYFARRYSLSIAGVVEQVPEVPPAPRDLAELHRTMRVKGVRALFTEPAERSRLAQQIARDAKIKLAVLDPLETGRMDLRAYEDGMKRNAETLLKTLR